jgi:predicted ATPase
MLGAIFGPDWPVRQEFLRAIYSLAEGNPFFGEELLRSLIASGGWDRQPVNELPLPAGVHEPSGAALSNSPDARQVLVPAAVLGQRFDFKLLQNLTRRDEAQLLQLIKELVAAQLVGRGGRPR